MGEEKNYYILTNSIEKFKALENAYKKFKENYIISLSNSKLVIWQNPLLDKHIHIYPETKDGEIKEIITIESNLEGRILKSDNGFWLIELEKEKYFINSKNPDFKN